MREVQAATSSDAEGRTLLGDGIGGMARICAATPVD
jgi:hypothetical protein